MAPATDPTDTSIVIQAPPAPAQLLLLFHGVGAAPQHMAGLGQFFAAAFPQAAVVSVAAARPADMGAGRMWFSVSGVTEQDRASRVAAAMPAFRQAVRHWQQRFGIAPQATALIGFSQGAIMALESARLGAGLAGRILAIAGRFAELPQQAPEHLTLHLVHGKEDRVIPYANTIAAAERLVALGADVTADVLPFAGHEITQEMADLLLRYLQTHVPLRHWRAAQADEPQDVRPVQG